eukprot:4007256-Prymnesium_polylepis.1
MSLSDGAGSIGHTTADRRLDLITISSPSNIMHDAATTPVCCLPLVAHDEMSSNVASNRYPVFVISSRVRAFHLFWPQVCDPGESPASLVMHGLLSFLTSSHPKAIALREHAIIKLVRMAPH